MPKWVDPLPALKRRVADEILVLIDGQSQTWAAWAMHSTQSRVSDLRRGRLDTMSLDRLVQCLSHLGRHVELTTAPMHGRARLAHERVHPQAQLVRAGRCGMERSYLELESRE